MSEPGPEAQELLELLRALLEHHDAAVTRPSFLCGCYQRTERAPHDLVEPPALHRAREITGVLLPHELVHEPMEDEER